MMLRQAVCAAGAILLIIEGSHCQLSVCGRAPLNPKIIGGQSAVEGSWPWHASIHYSSGNLLCGGSLINKDWVLSAAQCFLGTSPSNLKIYLGRHRRTDFNPPTITKDVIRIINHPKYDPNKHRNDIALLQLSSSVTFNEYIRPVCLAASGSSLAAGTEGWVTGWGSLNSGGTIFPEILQEVKIPIVSNSACKSAYGSLITDDMMCAGLSVGGKDACIGDAGGPMVNNGTQWIQSGIVSVGQGCAQAKYPGVYTRVSQYQSWISSQISSDQPGFIKFYSSGFRSSPSLSLLCLSLTFSILPVIFSILLKI